MTRPAPLRLRNPLRAFAVVVAFLAGAAVLPQWAAAVPEDAIRYVYDDAGQLRAVTDRDGHAAGYSWDAVGNLLSIDRFETGEVTVLQVSPGSGPVGATVRIYGTGFAPAAADNTVRFNGEAATISSASRAELVVVVPQGATTGPVRVETPGGAAESADAFTVTQSLEPEIAAVNPHIAATGDPVTVQGSRFMDAPLANSVLVNGVQAEVTSAASNSLGIRVPEATGSGRVSVTTPNGQDVGPDLFIPPPGYVPADVVDTGRLTYGQAETVSIGEQGKIALLVFEGKAGNWLSMRATDLGLKTYFTVYRPDGSAWVSSGFSSEGSMLSDYQVPEDGTYTILLEPQGSETGSFSLTAYEAGPPEQLVPTSEGASQEVTVPAPGLMNGVSFRGRAGQRIFAKVSNPTIYDGFVSILKPNGDYQAGASNVGSRWGAEKVVETTTLPSAGVYTFVVNPLFAYTGSATVTLFDVPADQTGSLQPTETGASKTLEFATPGQEAALSFEGEAGQWIGLAGAGVESGVRLLSPAGTSLASLQVQSQQKYMNAARLPADGTYTFAVDPEYANTGAVTLTAYSAGPPDDLGSPTPEGGSRTVEVRASGLKNGVTFEGHAGQRVAVEISGTSFYDGRAYIERPDGSGQASDNHVGSRWDGGFIETSTLPADGTYTVVVDPDDAHTGSAELSVFEVPADQTGSLQPSVTGEPRTLEFGTPGQSARLTFEGQAGEWVGLVAEDVEAKSRLSILRPDGSQLGSQATVDQDGEYLDAIELPADGTYTFSIDPEEAATGSITVKAYSSGAPAALGLSPAGATAVVDMPAPGMRDAVRFQGQAGQRVSVRVANPTFAAGYLRLRKPDGGALAWDASVGSTEGLGFIDTTTLPATGTYTIEVDPDSAHSGSADVSLFEVPADNTGSLQPTGTGEPHTLSFSTPGQNARLTFDGQAGELVGLVAEDVEAASRLSVLRANGSQVGSQATVDQDGEFLEAVELPADGTYTFLIDPQEAAIGTIALKAYSAGVPQTIGLTPAGATAVVDMPAPGMRDAVRFQGQAGQRVSVRVANPTFAAGYLRLRKPDGGALAWDASVGSTEGLGFIDTTTLPATGTYTIEVDPDSAHSGSADVSLFEVPADQTGSLQPTGAGESRTMSFSTPGENAKLTFDGQAGQWISLKGSTTATNSHARIVRPGGHSLGSLAINGQDKIMDAVQLPAQGTYTIDVDPQEANTGLVTVTAYSAGPPESIGAPTAAGATRTVAMPGPGLKNGITFQGVASKRVSVTLTNASFYEGTVSIRKPDGSYLAGNGNVGTRWGSPSQIAATTLPTNGTYTVLVDPHEPYTGEATITVYDKTGLATMPGAPGLTLQYAALWSSDESGTAPAIARQSDRRSSSNTISAGPRHPSSLRAAARLARSKPNELRRATQGRSSDASVTSPAQPNPRGTTPSSRSVDDRPSAGGRSTSRATGAEATRGDRRAKAPRHRGQAPDRRGSAFFRPAFAPSWHPTRQDIRDGWVVRREESPWRQLEPLQADTGETALAGQVLKLNGVPAVGVRLEIDGTDASTVTDRTGRFLLKARRPGKQILVVDGAPANRRGERYGIFEIQVKLRRASTTVLDDTVWMTPLDRKGDLRVGRRTKRNLVLKNPRIPGLEVRIPAGSVIRGRDGKRIRRLNLTAVPLNRPPFPLPHAQVPVYFSLQPGGAYFSKGAQIIYPNLMQLAPGQRVDFWDYDPGDRGWHIYGRGTVSADGKQLVPDRGVRLWGFTGAMGTSGPSPPEDGPRPAGGASGGDPVDLGTGMFVYRQTDLHVSDVIPAEIARTYRPGDTNSYSFGRGTTSLYDLWLYEVTGEDAIDLVLPHGGRLRYERANPGSAANDAVYEATPTPGALHRSRLRRVPMSGFDLELRDGSIYAFGYFTPLREIRDRFGNSLRIKRENGSGRITQVTTPHGRWIRFDYDSQSRVTSVRDNGGRTVTYTYGSGDRLATATDTRGGTTTYTYDSDGRMTEITDPRGITYLKNTYNGLGQIVEQELANGGKYRFDYNFTELPCGNMMCPGYPSTTDVTDPRGQVRRVRFNSAGWVSSDTQALGTDLEQTTTFAWTNAGLVESIVDPLGRKTSFAHDPRGNVGGVTRLADTPDATTTNLTYEPIHNQVTSVTDPLGHSTVLDYDDEGRLTTVRDATGRERTFTYTDAHGQPASATGPDGATTQFSYVGGDLVARTDPLGRTTRYSRDALGRLVGVTTPLGAKTKLGYNAQNQLAEVTDPEGRATRFEHDANGNLTEVVDARGNTTTATYNAMDQLASWADGLGRSQAYDYDAIGNLTTFTDRKGQVTSYRYDALNRPVFAGFGTGGSTSTPTFASTIDYRYDAANRLTEALDSSGGTYTQAYDALDRLTAQSGPGGIVSYAYDTAGRRTSMTAPGQQTTVYGYDDANRLTAIGRGTHAVSIGYDDAGRRAAVTLPNGVQQTYAYDDASQLTELAYSRASTSIGTLNYGYDADGHRTAMWGTLARTLLPDPLESATYDAANQRIAQGGVAHSYDANGNLTSDGAATYSWNARNELDSIADTAQTAEFSYDPFGRRRGATIDGATRTYLYDGLNVVQEHAGGEAIDLLTGLALDDLFLRKSSSETRTYLRDAVGSTLALTDVFGTATTSYSYGPFGETTSTGATTGNRYEYTGRENDGTGLYHYRARYYSPAMARFVSEDPIGLDGGDANFYAYVGNQPTSRRDPTGLYMEVSDDVGVAPGGRLICFHGRKPGGDCRPAPPPDPPPPDPCDNPILAGEPSPNPIAIMASVQYNPKVDPLSPDFDEDCLGGTAPDPPNPDLPMPDLPSPQHPIPAPRPVPVPRVPIPIPIPGI